MIPGPHHSSVVIRASLRAGSSPRLRWLLVRASRLPRIAAGCGSKRQSRRPLALLAALVLIAAVAPPMASAMTRDGTESGVTFRTKKDKADEILRELYGSSYKDIAEDKKERLRECTRDDKCLKELQYGAQFSRAR
jgi:hypothetical protein